MENSCGRMRFALLYHISKQAGVNNALTCYTSPAIRRRTGYDCNLPLKLSILSYFQSSSLWFGIQVAQPFLGAENSERAFPLRT